MNVDQDVISILGVLEAQWLVGWTVTRAIGLRTSDKANHIIRYALGDIQYKSEVYSAELVLYLCE